MYVRALFMQDYDPLMISLEFSLQPENKTACFEMEAVEEFSFDQVTITHKDDGGI